jgi:hypothetical protein
MLVGLFEHWSDADVITMDAASEVFDGLADPTDGAILKRDLMGLGANKPCLIPSIPATDFLWQ